MTENERIEAWNSMVETSEPNAFHPQDIRRTAAIACRYMSLANRGGLNSFLTISYDLGTREVLESLEKIGATVAAREFQHVIDMLGTHLLASSETQRWNELEMLWSDGLNEFDVLTDAADSSIVAALEEHIETHGKLYLDSAPDEG